MTNKTLLSTALAAAMGVSASSNADIIGVSWTGDFTMLGASGGFVANTDTSQCTDASCARTAISGTLFYDTASGAGTGGWTPFSFFGNGFVTATALDIQTIGNGFGGPGNLILGNMGFNWNHSYGHPASIVWDASGFLGAVNGGLTVGQSVSGVGALSASDNTRDGDNNTHPMGPALMAATTWNTTNVGTIVLGTVPSGTLPLISDTVTDVTNGDTGIAGSPGQAGAFAHYNFNIDLLSMTVTTCTDTGTAGGCAPAVPVPPAVWLFGSGLVGLIGFARRKA